MKKLFFIGGGIFLTLFGCKKDKEMGATNATSAKFAQTANREIAGHSVEFNGTMLVFESMEDYQFIHDKLMEDVKNEVLPIVKPEDRSTVVHPALDAFENDLGFTSLRKADENIMFADLLKGKSPENIQSPYVLDFVRASLLNERGSVQIGSSVFCFRPQGIYEIKNADPEALQLVESATGRVQPSSVIIIVHEPPVSVDDPQGVTSLSLKVTNIVAGNNQWTVTFLYTGWVNTAFVFIPGDLSPSVAYTTNGNGTKSFTHIYTISGAIAQGVIGGNEIRSVTLNFTICNNGYGGTTFSAENSDTGTDFKNLGLIKGGTVTNKVFNWNFGDGGASNQENPSHIYTCDGTYTVSLLVSFVLDGLPCSFSHTQAVVAKKTGILKGQVNDSFIKQWYYQYYGDNKMIKYSVFTEKPNIFHPNKTVYDCRLQNFTKIVIFLPESASLGIETSGNVLKKVGGSCNYSTFLALNDSKYNSDAIELVMHEEKEDSKTCMSFNPLYTAWGVKLSVLNQNYVYNFPVYFFNITDD